MIKYLTLSAACVLASIFSGAPAGAVEGTVTLARVSTEALVIWDCTDRVSALRDAKVPNPDILKTLESEAATVLADTSRKVAKQSQSLTVRVLYRKLGAFDPRYRAVTFAGIEPLVTVTSALPVTEKQAATWADALKAGQTPKELKVAVIGELPAQ